MDLHDNSCGSIHAAKWPLTRADAGGVRAPSDCRIPGARRRFGGDHLRHEADRQHRSHPRGSRSLKVTVDASVAVKWFVAEDHRKEARNVLGPRIERYAPDLLPVECASAICKKAHRREIARPAPFLDEIARLGEVVRMQPSANLLRNAAETALRDRSSGLRLPVHRLREAHGIDPRHGGSQAGRDRSGPGSRRRGGHTSGHARHGEGRGGTSQPLPRDSDGRAGGRMNTPAPAT